MVASTKSELECIGSQTRTSSGTRQTLFWCLSCNISNFNWHILSFLILYFKYYYFVNSLIFTLFKNFLFSIGDVIHVLIWSMIWSRLIPVSLTPGVWELWNLKHIYLTTLTLLCCCCLTPYGWLYLAISIAIQ